MNTRVKLQFSPHFNLSQVIPVEFIILHYTACSLAETLEIFFSPEKEVCAHFVIDLDGTIYDLGDAWSGPALYGKHAGKSIWEFGNKRWENLNECSLGVELINLNGNVFRYTANQYRALSTLTKHLNKRYPQLSADRILGHEQVAGWRGKVDPGRNFDWDRFFRASFPKEPHPKRVPVVDAKLWYEFEQVYGKTNERKNSVQDWANLNTKLEAFVAERNLKPIGS